MTAAGTGRGQGKVLLCGEHAVVYGHPAIALAVDRGTDVGLTRHDGPTTVQSPHTDPRVSDAVLRVLPPEGMRVEVSTDLPVGRGMGSSAALAVALVRAKAALAGEHLDLDAVYEAAMPIERAFHGNPSGVDVAVSARGGCLWFERGRDGAVRQPLEIGDVQLVVLDSGHAGDTAALVAGVAAGRPGNDAALAAIGDLVHQARSALHDPDALGAILSENHARLREIGVSTPQLDDLVQLACSAGACGAKLSGAGGGGIVLAVTREPDAVLRAAEGAGVSAFGCVPWHA